ncbi:hypothetical protein COT97_00010 [Candidatus Falkowbacteria bacterium CG10_big_fil_rev_8_21_14_0_10_39_11]|uniref:Lipopolysaccharide assembly protein A domain-containing protein n=1 Tax=Candidatus Falkowbacteria bacterium CG10_big_fil_rev_8_21_14_0_10_39_11 TaxID=1974565 RepID=A0A2H0V6C9_9BACT|nr:MAG: hypothetical protein COT97_00010 [Candidatus Falkowbacteria bacterium CG10_big_fil_rev_8_21_14_0_10_39_11]
MLRSTLIGVTIMTVIMLLVFFADGSNSRHAVELYNNLPDALQFVFSYGLIILAGFAIMVSALYDVHRRRIQNQRYQLETQRTQLKQDYIRDMRAIENQPATQTEGVG